MTRRMLRVIAASAVAALLGGVAVNAVARDSSDPTASKSPTPTVAAGLEQGLGVFADARSAEDALPVAALRQLPPVDHDGINPDLARRALASGDQTLYLVPAQDTICAMLVSPDGSAWTPCSYSDAVAKGINGPAVSVEGKLVTILGVVPDDVEAVDVILGEREQRTIPVENNAFIGRFDIGDQPTMVTYTSASGPVTFPVKVPDIAAIASHERERAAAR